MSSTHVETLTSPQAIDALATAWGALEAGTPEATGFQSFAWCRAWIEAAREEALEFRVVTLRADGQLVMLWPMQIEGRFGARILRWLGEPMTQYGDALALPSCERKRWRDAVLAEIGRWRDVDLVALTKLRRDGVLAGADLELARGGDELAAPFVDLRALRPQRRESKSAQRRRRKLMAFGEVRFEQAATASRSRELMRTALAQKREWLREKGFFSCGLSHRAASSFLDLLTQGELLRLHALTAGPHIAAIDIGFVRNGVYRSLLGSYDLRCAEGAPGHALTMQLIACCAAEGLAAYDFLAPADPYKLEFADGATPVGAHFKPLSLKGYIAAFMLAQLRPMAKRLAGAAAHLSLFRACRSFLGRAPRRGVSARISAPSRLRANFAKVDRLLR
ncbi:MAG TPA: GNAT family N-acetyltransferase [Methylocystis sp.]|nr:GNAT family N-acetyltransferase [Methylocystis sp.]